MNKKLLKLVALASIIALPLVGCGSDSTGLDDLIDNSGDTETPIVDGGDNGTTPVTPEPIVDGGGNGTTPVTPDPIVDGGGNGGDNGGVTPGPVTSTEDVAPTFIPDGMMPDNSWGTIDIDAADFSLTMNYSNTSGGFGGIAWLNAETKWDHPVPVPENTTAVTFEAKASQAANLIKAVAKISDGVETELYINLTEDWQTFSISYPNAISEAIHPFMIFIEGTEQQTLSVRNVKFAN